MDDEKHIDKKGISSSHHNSHSANSIDYNSFDFFEKLQHILGLEVLLLLLLLLSILLHLLLLRFSETINHGDRFFQKGAINIARNR